MKETQFLPPTDLDAWAQAFQQAAITEPAAVSTASRDWILKSYSLDEVAWKADAFYRAAVATK
ncbi:MAG: hypothetical protein EOP11_23640 [Proteobacteria bacterium]|nr:MAG: hypothetical protein EOP11_23640 [Pseudomonadota bacterium]